MLKSDQRLVRKFLRAGDEAAFRELYRRHTPSLYALALRLTSGSKSDAEDALQDTWVRACRTLAGFEWRSSLRTWLTGILINRARELRRETGRRGEEEMPEEQAATNGARHGGGIDLERALTNLPVGYREVLLLHDVEGYTHEEIGALLGTSAGTSKSQLHHARGAMRAALQRGREG